MRFDGRLVVAVTVVPVLAAGVALLVPGTNSVALVVGWVLTAVGSGAVLWPRYGDRTLGWPLVLASVVYLATVVAVFAAALSGVNDPS
jgi:hypothetical protein